MRYLTALLACLTLPALAQVPPIPGVAEARTLQVFNGLDLTRAQLSGMQPLLLQLQSQRQELDAALQTAAAAALPDLRVQRAALGAGRVLQPADTPEARRYAQLRQQHALRRRAIEQQVLGQVMQQLTPVQRAILAGGVPLVGLASPTTPGLPTDAADAGLPVDPALLQHQQASFAALDALVYAARREASPQRFNSQAPLECLRVAMGITGLPDTDPTVHQLAQFFFRRLVQLKALTPAEQSQAALPLVGELGAVAWQVMQTAQQPAAAGAATVTQAEFDAAVLAPGTPALLAELLQVRTR